MSISDLIVLMKEGSVHQIGKPQEVYDDPVDLFVAKFLGTPPVNVFSGEIKDNGLYISGERVLDFIAPDGKVVAAVRPEGLVPDRNGAFTCRLERIEVMGRDTSVVFCHELLEAPAGRAIVASSAANDGTDGDRVRFSLKPEKVLIFDPVTEERIRPGGKK